MANSLDMEGVMTKMDAVSASHEALQLSAQNDGYTEIRSLAFERFSNLGFPTRKFEEYKYSPFATLVEKSIDFLKTTAVGVSIDEVTKHLYDEAGSHLVFVNGRFESALSKIEGGIVLGTISSEQLQKKLEDTLDPFALLNLAFSKGGTSIEKTTGGREAVFVYHFHDFREGQVISQPQITLKVGPSRELDIVEKHIFLGEGPLFFNPWTHASVGQNAVVNWNKVQVFGNQHLVVDSFDADQERDSRFYINTVSFSGKLVRNNLHIAQQGENCESHMGGLYLLDGSTHVDNHTNVDHKFPNSYSNELYKGIVDDRSRAVFNGKIFVRPGAQKTNAFQSNNNVSLSDFATVNTKPQLEIWADDVKCSHGCTVGQLDEEAIFYLRARGLDERSAKAMLLIAFAEDTLSNIPVDVVKEEVSEIIARRLKK